MTTHRRYYFEAAAPETGAWDHERATKVLHRAAEVDWWFNEPLASVDEAGVLRFEFTASGRDQWWCHRRAMGLAERLFRATRQPLENVPVPMWESLAPHTNRGRWRVPAAS